MAGVRHCEHHILADRNRFGDRAHISRVECRLCVRRCISPPVITSIPAISGRGWGLPSCGIARPPSRPSTIAQRQGGDRAPRTSPARYGRRSRWSRIWDNAASWKPNLIASGEYQSLSAPEIPAWPSGRYSQAATVPAPNAPRDKVNHFWLQERVRLTHRVRNRYSRLAACGDRHVDRVPGAL